MPAPLSLPPCALCPRARPEQAESCCQACETWFCSGHGFPGARLCVGCSPECLWRDHLQDRLGGSSEMEEALTLSLQQKRNIALQIKQNQILARNSRRVEAGSVCVRECNLLHVLPPPLRSSSFPRSIQHDVPEEEAVCSPVLDLLKVLHPHPRDSALEFDPHSHVYTWCGNPTKGSVTSLIKLCARSFNPSETIRGMRAGANWPRVGYLKPYMSLALLEQVRAMRNSEALVSALAQLPLSDTRVVAACRQFAQEQPAYEHVKDMVSLSDEEILDKWETHRKKASRLGTRMHSNIEAFLNCGSIRPCTVELSKAVDFFRSFFLERGLTLYRTEWQVYATDENLAGSIDCVARAVSGQVVLLDWKRSKDLAERTQSYGRLMSWPLDTVPDCAVQHYNLQLNVYAWILERYYSCRVASMYVVGFHPEDPTFVHQVPLMVEQTERLMAFQRSRAGQDRCGGAHAHPLEQQAEVGAASIMGVTQDRLAQAGASFPSVAPAGDRSFQGMWAQAGAATFPDMPMQAGSASFQGVQAQAGAQAQANAQVIQGVQVPANTQHLRASQDRCGGASQASEGAPRSHVLEDSVDENDLLTQLELLISPASENGLPQAESEELLLMTHPQSQIADLPAPSAADLTSCKKRRLLHGAAESNSLFERSFTEFHTQAQEILQNIDVPAQCVMYSIVGQSKQVLDAVRREHEACSPQQHVWPEQLVRIVAAASVMPRIRVSDAHLREHILLLWLMQGDRFLRCHRGTCYLYNEAGAFQAYRGCPSEQTVARVKEFILHLEGLLKLLPPTTDRSLRSIVAASDTLLQDASGDVEELLDSCTRAAVFTDAERRAKARVPDVGEGGPAESLNAQHQDWTSTAAQVVNKLSLTLQREIMDDKIYALLNEWCETPHKQQAGVAYADCCTRYDVSGNVTMVPADPSNDIYYYVPHRLRPELPDPVLKAALQRLQKFFQETFWLNIDVFTCCQAAQALAKRGLNIDRCFIGVSPGGVGQSLYSAHLNAVYAHNHAYIDPNIWYDDQELRKQVEQFASCFILTAQEAPETAKRMREDLYKKTMSGDGIAGRRPYGYVTRMIELSGWKRMEVNNIMPFKGVTESNFNSILRRSFVWKPKARFANPDYLRRHYPDAHLDGFFAKDPSLKDFLVSGPAVASSLQLQFGFELAHTREECVQLIENYVSAGGDAGLTENKMREACGLSPRSDAAVANPVLRRDSSSQEAEEKKQEFVAIVQAVIDHLWSKNSSSAVMTATGFSYVKLPPNSPKMARAKLVEVMLDQKYLLKITSRTNKEFLIPFLQSKAEAVSKYVALPDQPPAQVAYPEIWHLDCLQAYATASPTREHNIITIVGCLDAAVKRVAKKHGKKSEAEKLYQAKLTEMRESIEKCEQKIADCLAAATRFAAGSQSPRQRQTSKKAPVLNWTTTYRMNPNLGIRGHRYCSELSAQGCPHRLLFYLCPDTIDLDIENAFFSIMFQFLQKLDLSGEAHTLVEKVLRQCAQERKQICTQQLRVCESAGKKVLLQCVHGGVPEKDLSGKEIIKQLQQVCMYLKWIAISACPELYEARASDPACASPENSVLALLYQALEDSVLDAWLQCILQRNCQHVSLHFDGIRIILPPNLSAEQLCNECMEHIANATAFKLSIRVKQHYLLLEEVARACVCISQDTLAPCFEKAGNCIPAALAFLFEDWARVQVWLQQASAENEAAERHKCRNYRACASESDFCLRPSLGLQVVCPGRFLLHTEAPWPRSMRSHPNFGSGRLRDLHQIESLFSNPGSIPCSC